MYPSLNKKHLVAAIYVLGCVQSIIIDEVVHFMAYKVFQYNFLDRLCLIEYSPCALWEKWIVCNATIVHEKLIALWCTSRLCTWPFPVSHVSGVLECYTNNAYSRRS